MVMGKRTSQKANFQRVVAVTATGIAEELESEEREIIR
jgi:hypothetical protein